MEHHPVLLHRLRKPIHILSVVECRGGAVYRSVRSVVQAFAVGMALRGVKGTVNE